MAKAKPSSSKNAVRQKAKELREAQEKADRRIRNIIIAVVSVIVIAILAVLIFIVQSQKNAQPGESGATSGVPAQFAQGEPVLVSHLGVGQKDENLQDLTLYFSYTCHWCAYLETNVSAQIDEDVAAGKFNLILQPVDTANMAWIGPATSASLTTAAEDPEHFLLLHQEMMQYFNDQYAAQDGSVITDTAASAAKIAEIAKQLGVSDEVISHFGDNADEYLALSTQNWRDAEVEGRESLGTPELVFNGQLVAWGQGTPTEIYNQIITGMKAAGYTN